MIIGIGTDILEIGRIRRILDSGSGDRFLRRILTEAELRQAEARKGNLAEFAAGRFAAKEAVAKACGTGIGERVGFRDVEVTADSGGRPVCRLSGRAKAGIGFLDDDRLHLSISHSDGHAVAFVVWERTR